MLNREESLQAFREAPSGANVCLIDFIGIRKNDRGIPFHTVEIVHAQVREVKTDEDLICLSVTVDTDEQKSKTYFCWFSTFAFVVERYDRHTNRFDVQLSPTFVQKPYQDKWIEKNLTWSNQSCEEEI